jgi:Immunoglobulin I-set domain.
VFCRYVTRNGSFVINNIAEKDTNVYTCTVSNAAGSTSKTIQMNVLVPPFFKDEQQESVAIVVNHPMNISCSHYGVPTPDFSWYKDGSLLRIQSHYIT